MKIKALLAQLLSLCMFLPVLAQTVPAPPPPQQKPADNTQKPSDDQDEVVKITTNLVQVDAVVTKDGKPVTNLTADDFEIYEDGKKQTITSFAFISNVPNVASTTAPPASRDKKKIELPPGAPVNPNEPHRTVAFVVDDLGISAESMAQVRRQLKKFITEELQPNDLVAIIRTGGELGVLQQFTNDKRLLLRAMERLRWNGCSRVGVSVFAPVGSGNGIDDSYRCGDTYSQTLRALRFILDGMAELPGRKSLVLMSDSLPREDQEFRLSFDGPLRGESLETRSTDDAPRTAFDGFGNTRNMSALLQRLAEKAIRSSVVIYSVDTQGLPPFGPTAADQFRGTAQQVAQQMNATLAFRSRLLWNRQGGGDLIARQTGGYQVRNSNAFKLDKIMEDQSGYYLIGYRPTEETFNRRFHHINAKVKRSGMTLRTRFGFYGISEDEANRGKRTVRDLTNLALISPFAAQDVNVDISSFFASDKTGVAVVRSFVYIDAKDMTFTPENGRQKTTFDLHGVIFGDNGSIVEQVTRGATLSLSQSDYEYAMSRGMQLTFDIPVKKPGTYQVRIAARDKTSSRLGSAGQFVAVPNLSNKKLAVSGIILGTDSDPAHQALASPGARRFAPNSAVHFAYVIYNAGNESGVLRNLVMQAKLFRDDKEVFAGPEVPIKAAANQTDLSRVFASGSISLPQNLEPGNYYLQVSVMEIAGKNKVVPVVQWVDFEIDKS
jgi:VWFA-related protein